VTTARLHECKAATPGPGVWVTFGEPGEAPGPAAAGWSDAGCPRPAGSAGDPRQQRGLLPTGLVTGCGMPGQGAHGAGRTTAGCLGERRDCRGEGMGVGNRH